MQFPPHGHFSDGWPGYVSEGLMADRSRKKALREAGLYRRSSFGKAMEGGVGKSGSGGCLLVQSTVN